MFFESYMCNFKFFFTKKLHLSIAKILRYYNEWECIKTIANLVFGASNCLEKKYQHLYGSKLKKNAWDKRKIIYRNLFTSKISWNWFSHLYSHTYVSPDPIFILLLHRHIFTNWCTLKHNCYYTQLVLNISNNTTTTLCLLQNYVIM